LARAGELEAGPLDPLEAIEAPCRPFPGALGCRTDPDRRALLNSLRLPSRGDGAEDASVDHVPDGRHDHRADVEGPQRGLAARREDQYGQEAGAHEESVSYAGADPSKAESEEGESQPPTVAEVAPEVAEDPSRREVERNSDVGDRVAAHEVQPDHAEPE